MNLSGEYRSSRPGCKSPHLGPPEEPLHPQLLLFFYIRDEVLGPFVLRVAPFFPFQTTYYLNGHSFIEQELNRGKVGFRKADNAFLVV